jgi:hypothetical protein
VRLRWQIFSLAGSRRQVVVTARPEDPGATLEPVAQRFGSRESVFRAAALTRDGGEMVAQ